MGRFARTALIVVAAASCLLTAFLLGARSAAPRRSDAIVDSFVELGISKQSRAALEAGAYRGIVAAADDKYARYLTPAQYRAVQREEAGQFVGVGLQWERRGAEFVVRGVADGASAAQAGLAVGDVLVAVDGEAVTTSAGLQRAFTGRAGTRLSLTYRRTEEQTVELERRLLRPGGVRATVDDGLGVITIPYFTNDADRQVRAALRGVTRDGAKAIVLDLQGCPGGNLGQAARIVQAFVGREPIMRIASRAQTETVRYDEAAATRLRVAVLVDEGTGSAAEMVAVSLRDLGRPVVGVTTYGKAQAQLTLPLDNGAAILMSVSDWRGPKGTRVDGRGVTPTVVIEDPAARLAAVRTALLG